MWVTVVEGTTTILSEMPFLVTDTSERPATVGSSPLTNTVLPAPRLMKQKSARLK